MAQRDMSLTAFFEDVYLPRRLLGASPGTIQQYEIALNRFAVFIDREPLLSDLTEEVVSAFMADIVARGLSPVTANMRMMHLTILHRYAKRREYVSNLLDVRKLKAPKRLPTAWTVGEVEKIVESARMARGRYFGVPAGAWWEAMVLVLYDTGIRKSAAFAIRFNEIDFTNKILRVPPERMKNLVEQYFRLHDQTIEAILATLPPRREQLFPWPFRYERALYGRFRRILKRAGLPFTRRDLFHRLRRTCATHIARHVGESMAIQQMGHQDQSTIKRYIDPRFTANHNAALMLERPAWINPRQIEVEVPRVKAEPLPEVTVTYSLADLRGEGEDVFARLSRKPFLEAEDIVAACEASGVLYKELAEGCKVSPDWISRVIHGKEDSSMKLSDAVRGFFGLDGFREERGEGRQPR
jgi:integrase